MNRRTRKLLRENDRLERQLTKENARVLTDMVVYLRASNTTEYQQECVRRDITAMVLEGQARGLSVGEVIGGDYQAFCDAVLAEIPARPLRDRLLAEMGNGCLYVAVLLGIWLGFGALDWLLEGGGWPWVPVTAGNLAALAAILAASVGLVWYICKTSFGEHPWMHRAAAVLLFLLAGAALAAGVLLRQELFQVHALAAAGTVLALLAVHKIIGEALE